MFVHPGLSQQRGGKTHRDVFVCDRGHSHGADVMTGAGPGHSWWSGRVLSLTWGRHEDSEANLGDGTVAQGEWEGWEGRRWSCRYAPPAHWYGGWLGTPPGQRYGWCHEAYMMASVAPAEQQRPCRKGRQLL